MSDTKRNRTVGGRDRTARESDSGPTLTWYPVLVATVVAVGLTAAVGGAAATAQESARDPLTVATDCVDGTSEVTLGNPTDERVEATLTWDGEQSSIQVSAMTEPTVETGSGTHTQMTRLGLGTEPSAESVTVAVSAGDSVTVEGLADGTYDVSASADGEDVPVTVEDSEGTGEAEDRTSELRLECGADAADNSSGDGSSADRRTTETASDGDANVALEEEAASIDDGKADANATDNETTAKHGAGGDENRNRTERADDVKNDSVTERSSESDDGDETGGADVKNGTTDERDDEKGNETEHEDANDERNDGEENGDGTGDDSEEKVDGETADSDETQSGMNSTDGEDGESEGDAPAGNSSDTDASTDTDSDSSPTGSSDD